MRRHAKQRTKLPAPKPKRVPRSPLDRAAGDELVWAEVAPVFEVARKLTAPEFTYFVGEEGGIKIGFSDDPLRRLRELQTGNPRTLVIERVLIGGRSVERTFHERWAAFRGPKSEWFAPEIRPNLFAVVDAIREAQIAELHDHGRTDHLAMVRRMHDQGGVSAPDRARLLRA